MPLASTRVKVLRLIVQRTVWEPTAENGFFFYLSLMHYYVITFTAAELNISLNLCLCAFQKYSAPRRYNVPQLAIILYTIMRRIIVDCS